MGCVRETFRDLHLIRVLTLWHSTNDMNSPALDWSTIQPALLSAGCDVVILLDCCFAGQAARARTKNAVEFLAATNKDEVTPTGHIANRPSFTTVLIRELKAMMAQEQEARIPQLHRRMSEATARLVKQPFYVELTEGSAGKIVLRKHVRIGEGSHSRLRSRSTRYGNQGSYLTLRVSTFGQIDSTIAQALTAWMTRESPSIIADIELVRNTMRGANSSRRLGEHLLRSHEQGRDSRAADQPLSAQSSSNIGEVLSDLTEFLKIPSPENLTDDDAAMAAALLKEKSDRLVTTIEDALPSLGERYLRDLQDLRLVEISQITKRIDLRLKVLDDEASACTLTVNFTDKALADQRFRLGTIGSNNVMVEYRGYDEDDKGQVERLMRQVSRVSALLMEPKPSTFRCLDGMGIVKETLLSSRIGFVYHTPENREAPEYTALSQFIQGEKSVALDKRVSMARALCEALLNLHSVGWLHKAIKSENVLLFKDDNTGSAAAANPTYDLDNPYLIGFDCSRPADAETRKTVDFTLEENLYRHPDRWGNPVRYQRQHDIYAFVCSPGTFPVLSIMHH